MNIRVIFEDNQILVIEKPVNIPVQRDISEDDDVLTILKQYIKEKYNKPGNVYLGLVHRLDRPTGVIMVFARTSKAAGRLSSQIREGSFRKSYFAVTHGRLGKPENRLKHYLLKNSSTNTVRVVVKGTPDSQEAELEYTEVRYSGGLSLMSINLITGRSHQIRVQFSVTGHPLWGDQKYGPRLNKPGQQLALWSTEIEFFHPVSGEKINFRCNPPHEKPWDLFGF
jgi:23S rRNA pseudouridine1911/1915/1917 synthase